MDLVTARDGSSHDDVTVPIDVLGEGMDDDVSTQEQRLLEVGRRERVVHADDHVRVGLLGDRRHLLDVDQLERGVRGRLDPDHLGVGAQGGDKVLGLVAGQVDEGHFDALAGHDALEVADRAAVQVVHGDDVVASFEQVAYRRVCSEAGREDQTMFPL